MQLSFTFIIAYKRLSLPFGFDEVNCQFGEDLKASKLKQPLVNSQQGAKVLHLTTLKELNPANNHANLEAGSSPVETRD